MKILLSIVVPTLDGSLPDSLPKDPRVEIIAIKSTSPVGRARNEGLKRATGEYLAWVDADDILTDDWLAKVLSAIEQKVDVAVLDFFIDWERRSIKRVWNETGRGLLADLLNATLTPEVWRYVIRRELWQGITFDDTMQVAEDFATLPKVIAKAKTWLRIGAIYRYQVRPNSLIHSANPEFDRLHVEALLQRAEYWRTTPLADEALSGTLKALGWVNEGGRAPKLTRQLLRQHYFDALCCQKLSLCWKLKLLLLILNLGFLLKPGYFLYRRLHG